MMSLGKINLEYKSTALFGVIALFMSLLTGFAAGISWNVVILRSMVLSIVFAAIGYGICFIFKKYVPELYQMIASLATFSGRNTTAAGDAGPASELSADGTADAGERDLGPVSADGGPAVSPADNFMEFDGKGLDHYSSDAPGGGTGDINTGTGKLGKHILEKEKLAKYEPKIMAQAVRTMMSKDRA